MKNKDFITGKVPITKEEVRAISLNKLELLNAKTFIDVGAGTGSVSIEAGYSYPNLKVRVLKAGHHGSKGSSSEAFLDQLKPSLALVSAGENNRYKHPNDETLERFKERHIKVLRTDQDGAIRFKGWFQLSSETVR